MRCGVPDRHAAHLVVAVGRPVLGPALEQRQPQPRRIGLHAEVDGRAGQRAAPPERRLDVHHPHDGRAEHRARVSPRGRAAGGCTSPASATGRRPGDLVARRRRAAPAGARRRWRRRRCGSRPRAWRRAACSATRSRIAPARPVPLRGLIVANSRRSPTNDLAALRTLQLPETLVDAARPGTRTPPSTTAPASIRPRSVLRVSIESRPWCRSRTGGRAMHAAHDGIC